MCLSVCVYMHSILVYKVNTKYIYIYIYNGCGHSDQKTLKLALS